MAKIDYSNQINYTGNAYLDPNMMPVESYQDLLNIPLSKRFVGLEIVVLHDEQNSDGKQARYWLNSGIQNSNWEKKSEKLLDSTISGSSNTLTISIEEKQGVLNKLEIDATNLATTAKTEELEEKIDTEVQDRISGDTILQQEIDTKQNILTAGENILISGDTISSTVKSTLKDPILTSTKVGYIEQNTLLTSGTSFEDIFKQMLSKELDVTPHTPTTTLINSGDAAGNREIGSTFSVTLSHTYSDGYFASVDPSEPTQPWGQNQPAGCQEGTTEYYRGSTKLVSNTDTQTVINGTISYNCKTQYGANTITPKTNYGNDSTKTINAGTATSQNISFTGYYRAYYIVNTSTQLTTSSSFQDCVSVCTNNSLMSSDITVIGNTAQAIGDATHTKYAYVLIPKSKSVPTFQNEFGNQFTMEVINDTLTNSYGTEYKLCTTNINGHAGDKYKNCTIKK